MKSVSHNVSDSRVKQPSRRALIRARKRKDGTTAYAVNYLLDNVQTSATFDDKASAEAFKAAVKAKGPEKAMDMFGVARTVKNPAKEQTVTDWVQHHIDHLTGIQPATRLKYQAYLNNDITPHLGDIPLKALAREDIVSWVQVLEETVVDDDGTTQSGKTIKNKCNFLSGCMNAAIPKEILYNPCHRVKLPEWKRAEKTYLEREEVDLILSCVTEYWRPLVEFLVASGLRWAEATALTPNEVSVKDGTVRVWQSWKIIPGGWVLGPPKSKKSVRTVNIPVKVLKRLDLSNEFVFVNRDDGPVRIQGFHRRVWEPARLRAKELGLEKRPRIHDLRHTAVSLLMNNGADLPAIQAMVGHTSIATTIDVYSSLDRTAGKKLADIMDTQLSD